MFSKNVLISLICLSIGTKWIGAEAEAAANDFADTISLDKDFSFCRQEDKKISQCLLNSFQMIWARLPYGIPELNLAPAGPTFLIDEVNHEIANAFANGLVYLKNITINDLNAMNFHNVAMLKRENKYKMIIQFDVPRIQVEGVYQADLDVETGGLFRRANLDIEEEVDDRFTPAGEFNVTMTDIQVNATLFAEVYEEDGLKYLNFYGVNLDTKLGNMLIDASGLTDELINFLNKFWQIGYKVILENTSPIWGPQIVKNFNQIFSFMPLHLFMPKDYEAASANRS